jgi:membrane fusion protein, multidrug efflux system
MIPSARMAVALLLAGALAGCQEQRPPSSSAVRPVLSTVATPKVINNGAFAGTIEPRYRSTLGFRVLGRMVSRDVNVGETVQKGRRLAALDSTPFELALQTARAEVSNATAQLENAKGAESRQRTLLDQKVIAEAQFEIAQRARVAAGAALARARANLAKAEQQLGYTLLRADFDGVVTTVEAEVGQVVQPGQTVVTLARPDIREAVIDLPEDVNGALKPGLRFEVALQLNPSVKASGFVREIAPQADPATRSRRVRITLDEPPPSFRLGTTVTATMSSKLSDARIELPLSAILERTGETLVWVVDPMTKTVALQQITLAARSDRSVLVAAGLAPGTRVVTAGVNSLAPGQAVRIEEESPR